MKPSVQTIADLMTDGCNMGVKSLQKYLNEYAAADERSKAIAKKLVNLRQKVAVDIHAYLKETAEQSNQITDEELLKRLYGLD